MLEADLSGRDYSKAEHNRRLQKRIGRSRGSIEFKHGNISAVLVNFGQPYIAEYKRRDNLQGLLEQAVLEWLAAHPRFFPLLADGPILAPVSLPAFDVTRPVSALFDAPPDMPSPAVEVDDDDKRVVRLYRTDFVRRDAENRRLGRMGEEWVLDVEKRRLHDDERRPDLAKRVEWTADVRGDGAGYDIASWNGDGSPRLIEVKTTGLGKQFPFMVTANEVRVSERHPESYHLYRVYEFARAPRAYVLPGSLRDRCRLEPTQFRARPGG